MEKTIQPDQRYTKGQTVLREEIFVFFFCLLVRLFVSRQHLPSNETSSPLQGNRGHSIIQDVRMQSKS